MKPHPFKKLTQHHASHFAVKREVDFEEARVRFILTRFKLNKLTGQLRQKEESESGKPHLTLRAFCTEFPSFPVLLGASTLDDARLQTDPSAMIPSLFKNFTGAPFVLFYDKFFDANEQHSQGRALGLVFPRKGINHGLVILNDKLDAVHYRGLTWDYTGGHKEHDEPFHLYVRPFQQVIEGIYNQGHGWRP